MYECNEPLRQLLIALRDAQKAFFKAQPGSLARAEALRLSKEREKILDEFLAQPTTPVPEQKSLFP